jgi:hypothetical protein
MPSCSRERQRLRSNSVSISSPPHSYDSSRFCVDLRCGQIQRRRVDRAQRYEATSIFRIEIIPTDGIRLPFFCERRIRYFAVFWQLSVKAIRLTARQRIIRAAQCPANSRRHLTLSHPAPSRAQVRMLIGEDFPRSFVQCVGPHLARNGDDGRGVRYLGRTWRAGHQGRWLFLTLKRHRHHYFIMTSAAHRRRRRRLGQPSVHSPSERATRKPKWFSRNSAFIPVELPT